MSAKKTSMTSQRTLIEPHKGDKRYRYVRRNKQGQFCFIARESIRSLKFPLISAAIGE
jgi:hypothetical protein